MELYLYEHVTARATGDGDDPLLAEAAAMRDALSADLAEIDGVEVVCGFADRFDELAAACDGVLLIAPETGGVLTTLALRVERGGGRLLSPASEFCAWASDKSRVADTMRRAGVPMPRGMLIRPGDPWPTDFPLPAVRKPNDGCGSQGVVLLPPGEGADTDAKRRSWADEGRSTDARLEEYVPGVAASIAILRGPAGTFPLPACSQRLSDDGALEYLGGSCPLPESLHRRAESLARRAAAAMPKWSGYIGLDLVLGAAADGSQDYLIEVNPRLTTSYVGLRAIAETNLAQAMLDVAAGREPRLSFRRDMFEFDADGAVRSAGTSPAAKS